MTWAAPSADGQCRSLHPLSREIAADRTLEPTPVTICYDAKEEKKWEGTEWISSSLLNKNKIPPAGA
jgi:hypothetical protein